MLWVFDIVEVIENGTTVEITWEQILAEERQVFERMYWVPPQLGQNPGY